MNKKFRRAPTDELEHIQSAAVVIADSLGSLRDTEDYAEVEKFLDRSRATFETLGTQMTSICDTGELTVWASRVTTVLDRIGGIERYLLTRNMIPFNWEYTLDGMGWIEAVRIGAEQTIGLNTDAGKQDGKGSPDASDRTP